MLAREEQEILLKMLRNIQVVLLDNLDGSSPKDNPKYRKHEWLSEIYQIGVRNPQGMTLSPSNNKVYISNHGARGGDFFGEVKFGENYGWEFGVGEDKITILQSVARLRNGINDLQKLFAWTPSIAVSAIQIYKGLEFPEWNNHILVRH